MSINLTDLTLNKFHLFPEHTNLYARLASQFIVYIILPLIQIYIQINLNVFRFRLVQTVNVACLKKRNNYVFSCLINYVLCIKKTYRVPKFNEQSICVLYIYIYIYIYIYKMSIYILNIHPPMDDNHTNFCKGVGLCERFPNCPKMETPKNPTEPKTASMNGA